MPLTTSKSYFYQLVVELSFLFVNLRHIDPTQVVEEVKQPLTKTVPMAISIAMVFVTALYLESIFIKLHFGRNVSG
jgi:amino acid transporter